ARGLWRGAGGQARAGGAEQGRRAGSPDPQGQGQGAEGGDRQGALLRLRRLRRGRDRIAEGGLRPGARAARGGACRTHRGRGPGGDVAAMSAIGGARRIVVKVGSSILIDPETGLADETWLNAFASDVARVRARGQQLLV